MRPIAALLLLPAAAAAQTNVGPHGVTAPGVRVDASGVHTAGATVNGSGVHGGARGGDVAILTNSGTRMVDCGGKGLSVQGNGNRLTVTNCPRIEVLGNGNRLISRVASPLSLSVMGNDDTVAIHAPPGVRFTSSVMGQRDHVTRGE